RVDPERRRRATIREPGYLAARATLDPAEAQRATADRRFTIGARSRRKEARVLFVSVGMSVLLSLDVTGVVADQSGRPVPRAIVQVVAADGTFAASTFTDADGVFRIANAPDGCRVQASLTGFVTATRECSAGAMTLTLAVAPLAEHVVVSPTRPEAPPAPPPA